MEVDLSLNRAALRHTNEMVEEKEEELVVINERHAEIREVTLRLLWTADVRGL